MSCGGPHLASAAAVLPGPHFTGWSDTVRGANAGARSYRRHAPRRSSLNELPRKSSSEALAVRRTSTDLPSPLLRYIFVTHAGVLSFGSTGTSDGHKPLNNAASHRPPRRAMRESNPAPRAEPRIGCACRPGSPRGVDPRCRQPPASRM